MTVAPPRAFPRPFSPLQQSPARHVPGVGCPGHPPLPSQRPDERDGPFGHPRARGGGREAAAPAAGRGSGGQSGCRAAPEGEGPNFALVFRCDNLSGRVLLRAWKTSFWHGAIPPPHTQKHPRAPGGCVDTGMCLCRAGAGLDTGLLTCGCEILAFLRAAKCGGIGLGQAQGSL